MAIIQLTRRGQLRDYSMPTIKSNFDRSSKHRASGARMQSAALRGLLATRLITVDYLNLVVMTMRFPKAQR